MSKRRDGLEKESTSDTLFYEVKERVSRMWVRVIESPAELKRPQPDSIPYIYS